MSDLRLDPATLALLCGFLFCLSMAGWCYKHRAEEPQGLSEHWAQGALLLLVWAVLELFLEPSPELSIALLLLASWLVLVILSSAGPVLPFGGHGRRAHR
ncbi:MAG TPA: hypothetical protein VGN26_21620 [Armatimonadota bacterium]|jgi:hypothetical protein